MRLLQVIPGLDMGGAERVVVTLTRAAHEAGHDAAVAAGPGPLAGELESAPFPLPLVNRQVRRLPAAAWALRAAIKTFRPEVVHAHGPTMAILTGLISVRGRGPRALVSMHGVPEEDYDRAATTLRLAGLPVVACGPGVATALSERGVSVASTIVNGISEPPAPTERSMLEREFPFVAGRPLLVSAGRLVEQKNHELAIEALRGIPGAVLFIMGDGPLRTSLERRVRELGVADRVELTGNRTDARAIIGAADALIMPSRWEGLPLTLLEALAAGTPVVATAVRGIRELVVDGETALLVPRDDASALGSAVTRLLKDHAVREKLASGGRELARSYSEAAMAGAFLDFYERLTESTNGGPRR